MGWFPVAAQAAGSLLQFSGAQKQASAAEYAGAQQQQAANFQAAQMTQQAGQEQAAAQRAAIDQRRQATLIASRAVAVAGASGGGVSDPTVQNIIADIHGEGAYRAALKLYQGEDAARQLRMGASAKTYEGQLARENARSMADAYRLKAWGGLAGSGATLFTKYGGGGSKSGSASALTGNGWYDTGTPDTGNLA